MSEQKREVALNCRFLGREKHDVKSARGRKVDTAAAQGGRIPHSAGQKVKRWVNCLCYAGDS